MATLPEGLKDAVRKFGREFILTSKVVGYLSDFHCWDNEAVRTVLPEALRIGSLNVLPQFQSESPQVRETVMSQQVAQLSAAGYNAKAARYVMDSFAYALGWIDEAPITAADESTASKALPELIVSVRGIDFKMVRVEGGTFMMGATPEHAMKANYDERPAVTVNLSSFWIATTLVTQQLWQAVMGENPSFFEGEDLPAERMTWHECQDFINRISSETGLDFRLPTEAEWEYAARGGRLAHGYAWAGCTNNLIDVHAWHSGNAEKTTHSVAMLSPNELGLYDMSGNVSEWCNDWYFSTYITARRDPQGPNEGTAKVARGGSWHDAADDCRVARRFSLNPSYRSRQIGLRLAMSAKDSEA